MRRRFRALRLRLSREDGQALVEFAFVLPLLLLFLFGVIDFGLALNRYNSETEIANVAARMLSTVGSNTKETCGGTSYTSLQSWVDCEAQTTGTPDPTVCVNSGTYSQGNAVTVQVSSTFDWAGILTSRDGYVAKVVNPTSSISASATMRLEQTPSSGSSFLTPTCSS